jgi:hypothetical protein
MITFTELEVILMVGWLITVLAFMSVSKQVTVQRSVMDAMDKIIQGVADNKLQVKRDKEDNIHITSME